eukprot:gnl/Dysnectes_brevis/2724_a3309_865.p1 GENE.gnl/Dysnectes_brevis/2724_a3309_865~~gnl/Dysnectes_brevis/2724_a3309_865.p1  ORF type:complete len:1191 (+),score=301.64 gnl/Dysnectes_brevis/2724_a3309_865:31-3573(+)
MDPLTGTGQVSHVDNVFTVDSNPEEHGRYDRDIKADIRHFIHNFDLDNYFYRTQLLDNYNNHVYVLNIYIEHLKGFNPQLADELETEPSRLINLFRVAARESLAVLIHGDQDHFQETIASLPAIEVTIQTRDISAAIQLRELLASKVNRLAHVSALVISASRVRPKATSAALICRRCGHKTTVPVPPGYQGVMLPSTCLRERAVEDAEKCPPNPYRVVPQLGTYTDHQSLKLQELPEEMPTGEMPRTVGLSCEGVLASDLPPGSRVLVTSVFCVRTDTDKVQKPFLRALGVRVLDAASISSSGMEEDDFTQQERDTFFELSRSPSIHDDIMNSICPALYGMSEEKQAIASLLFGGTTKWTPDGVRLRGDINVLLLGDPGAGKSQALKWASEASHVGIYTSGKGSSAAGLTAAVVKDSASGEFHLEGGALVLGDQGCVCFGKGTEVLRSDGSVARIEDIEVGDALMGRDGGPRTVESLSRGSAPMYSIQARFGTLPMGGPMIVNGDHILRLSNDECQVSQFNMSVKEWMSLQDDAKKRTRMVLFEDAFQTPAANPVVSVPYDHSVHSTIGEFDVTLSPQLAYLIGFWLGDGSCSGSTFGVKVSSHQSELDDTSIIDVGVSDLDDEGWVDESEPESPESPESVESLPAETGREQSLVSFLKAYVAEVHPSMRLGSGPWTRNQVHCVSQDGRSLRSPWTRLLRALGFAVPSVRPQSDPSRKPLRSNYKRIPEAVLTWPVEHRAALMAGLIDTDGHIRAWGTSFELIQKFSKGDPARPTEWTPMLKRLAMSLGMLMSSSEPTRITPTATALRRPGTMPVTGLIWGFIPGSKSIRQKLNSYLLYKKFSDDANHRAPAEFTIEKLEGPPQPFFGVNLDGDRLHVLPNLTVHHNCIDEMDKMRAQDRVAIHEAMEQQTISIAKAGITTILNARTSILAAANPVYGRYDDLRSAAEQIDFQTTILSRFDLIFIVRDIPDAEKDTKIAKHILELHRRGSSRRQMVTGSSTDPDVPISLPLLRRYIRFAKKQISPRLTSSAAESLQHEYVNMRSDVSGTGDRPTIPVTVRQLEALVRISESFAKMSLRENVTRQDVDRALSLFRRATMDAAHAGISETITDPRLHLEIAQAETAIRTRIPIGSTLPIRAIVRELVNQGLTEGAVMRALLSLETRGEFRSRKRGKQITRLQ